MAVVSPTAPIPHAPTHADGGSDTLSGQFTGITGVGTLTAGSTGAGFTVALSVATISGTLPTAQLPAFTGGDVTSSAGSASLSIGTARVTNAMLAGSITSSKLVGTDIATVGTLTAGSTGSGFTVALSVATITGTLADARLSTNVPLLNAANTFTAAQTINANLLTSGGAYYLTTTGTASPTNFQAAFGTFVFLAQSGYTYQFASSVGPGNLVADTGISRTAAATVAIGNGTQGNATGTLRLATLNPSSGIVGTATNNNAPAGDVGEFVNSLVASGSAVTLTNNIVANVASISLTAGDWVVSGSVNQSESSATQTASVSGISSTSATMPNDGSEVTAGVQLTLQTATNGTTLPPKRFSLSATTTIYLVTKATFSAGSVSAYGAINAWRVR